MRQCDRRIQRYYYYMLEGGWSEKMLHISY